MEHGAAAPACPAAHRRGLRASWQSGLCALAFLFVPPPALGQGNIAGFAGHLNVPDSSLLRTTRLETVSTDLHFAPGLEAPAIRVTPVAVRIDPVARPRLKPKPARTAPADSATGERNRVQPAIKLFGSPGKPVQLSPVTKRWQRALGQLEAGKTFPGKDRKTFAAYAAILDGVKPLRRGLVAAYRKDTLLHSTGEHWASPVETLARRAGDCEDFSILKYALLRDLGVKDEEMRIVVLKDTLTRQYHAVLAVRHKGHWLILDNRFSRVRFERDLPHYQALYSVNSVGEWAHAGKRGTPVRLAVRLKTATR